MNHTGITVRPARPSDAAALAALKRLSAEASYSGLVDPDQLQAWLARRASEEFLLSRINSDAYFLVAELNGRVAGGGLVRPESPGMGYLADVYVYPPSQGLGYALVSALLEHADQHYASLRCFVFAGNTRALEFFSSRGFCEVSRQPNAELDGSLVEMVR